MVLELIESRLYYTIGEVASLLNVKTSVIRFWEKEFAVLKPFKKSKNSKRKYKIKDIETLFKIKTLLYKEQFTIKGANEKIEKWKTELSFVKLKYHLTNNSSWSEIYSEEQNKTFAKMEPSGRVEFEIKKKILDIRLLLKKLQ